MYRSSWSKHLCVRAVPALFEMLYPLSRRCLSKLCRSVWQITRFEMELLFSDLCDGWLGTDCWLGCSSLACASSAICPQKNRNPNSLGATCLPPLPEFEIQRTQVVPSHPWQGSPAHPCHPIHPGLYLEYASGPAFCL